jgi:2-haloacid dehalogenase
LTSLRPYSTLAHSTREDGALAAGCTAAFVERTAATLTYPGMTLSPLGAQPDIKGHNLVEVADRIVAAT